MVTGRLKKSSMVNLSIASIVLLILPPCPGSGPNSDDPVESEEPSNSDVSRFEGDILGLDVDAVVGDHSNGALLLNGIKDKNARWPNGIVPYKFSPTLNSEKFFKGLVLKAMEVFEDNTCIRFVEQSRETAYLLIESGFDCASYEGKLTDHEGPQRVILSLQQCFVGGTSGIAQHELMHALGFYHEQSRVDRDDYVDINWDNIIPDKKIQFKKHVEGVTTFGEAYDFGSILHYQMNDFAINESSWTIRPKEKYKDKVIGQRVALSEVDIRKINKMYECPGSSVVPPPSTTLKPPVFDVPHRGCYFNYRAGSRTGVGHFTARDIDPELCTYVTVAYALIADNEITLGPGLEEGVFNDLNLFKKTHPNFKVLLSVGGPDSADVSAMAADPASRNAFTESVVGKLRAWGVDGLDVYHQDNLLSTGRADASQLTILFRDLRAEFEADTTENAVYRLALSAAVFSEPSSVILVDVGSLDKLLDIVHVVAYDLSSTTRERTSVAHHSPFMLGTLGFQQRYNMETIIKLWSTAGFTKSKLVAGIPLYGRGWLLATPEQHDLGSAAITWIPASRYTKEPKIWPYYEICHRNIMDGATVVFDPDILASYAYTDAWWIGYNDIPTVGNKTKWIRENAYGGVYAWDASQDDYLNWCGDGTNPLLNAIKSQLAMSSAS